MLETGLGIETHSQLHCVFQSLAGSESHKPVPFLGQDLCHSQPPFSPRGEQHDKAKMEPALGPGGPGHLLAV